MNSPPDPSSPSPSTPSSGSPPPEEAYAPNPAGTTNYLSNLTSHIGAAFSGSGSSKRRLPSGAFGSAGSNRDAKTRRRGESGRGSNWEGGIKENSGGKKEKDELIDTALVDHLRKEIGDPFLESSVDFKG